MLDLNKIALSLKKTLAKETTASIDAWFNKCDGEALQIFLGEGEYQSMQQMETICVKNGKRDAQPSEYDFVSFPDYLKAA